MTHLIDFTRRAHLTLTRWRGTTVVLGRNQAVKILLEKSNG